MNGCVKRVHICVHIISVHCMIHHNSTRGKPDNKYVNYANKNDGNTKLFLEIIRTVNNLFDLNFL